MQLEQRWILEKAVTIKKAFEVTVDFFHQALTVGRAPSSLIRVLAALLLVRKVMTFFPSLEVFGCPSRILVGGAASYCKENKSGIELICRRFAAIWWVVNKQEIDTMQKRTLNVL